MYFFPEIDIIIIIPLNLCVVLAIRLQQLMHGTYIIICIHVGKYNEEKWWWLFAGFSYGKNCP